MRPNFILIAVLLIVIGLIGFAALQFSSTYDPGLTEDQRTPPEESAGQSVRQAPLAKDTPVKEPVAKEPVEDVKEEVLVKQSGSQLDGEARAEQVVRDWLKTLSGYKDQRGRNVQIVSIAGMGCEGCYLVRLTYWRDLLYYPDKEEHVTVNAKLKDWKVDSYTFG